VQLTTDKVCTRKSKTNAKQAFGSQTATHRDGLVYRSNFKRFGKLTKD